MAPRIALAATLGCCCLAAAAGEAPLNEIVAGPGAYRHIVLGTSSFNATVFLPATSPGDKVYYNATRFDWSTQIGNVKIGPHTLFGNDFWRGLPHDPANAEAAVGLASEFGCGDYWSECTNGTLNYDGGSKNGVLGFEDAKENETFLKIGVGKLVKTKDFKYSPFFPYAFAEYPEWELSLAGSSSVRMQQEVVLNDKWGYRLSAVVSVLSYSIVVETTLTNLGSERIVTPHYSHNFLSVDRRPIGPPWNLSMVPNASGFMEPGKGAWSENILDYFRVDGTSMASSKEVPFPVKLKCDFIGKDNADAADAWTATFDGLTITSSQTNDLKKLYAYNFYIEKETISPEPMSMIIAEPGKSTSWTRILSFKLEEEAGRSTTTTTTTTTSKAAEEGVDPTELVV